MNKKIAISIGHYPQRQGNSTKVDGVLLTEYSENGIIAGFVQKYLTNKDYYAYIVPTGTLPQKTEYINNLNPVCAVELHFNGYPQSVKGHEVLYLDGCSKSWGLGVAISTQLSYALTNRNRGVKPSTLWFVKSCNCPAVIVEPFFMKWEKNYLDSVSYRVIAQAVAEGINQYSN